MKFSKYWLAMAFIMALFSACEKEKEDEQDDNSNPNPTVVTKSSASVMLEHGWGPTYSAFNMGVNLRHPMTGDTLRFTKMAYYISNIQLVKSDGTVWTQPESYYLVDLDKPASLSLKLDSIPAGEYTNLRMMLGVDSTRNVSGAQEGALSVANNMFWSWNSGYIFVKAEGDSPQSSDGRFEFHLGGFRQTNTAIQNLDISFGGDKLTIVEGKMPMVHLKVNVSKLWHDAISVSQTSKVHMPGAVAATKAKNFGAGIIFDHLHQ